MNKYLSNEVTGEASVFSGPLTAPGTVGDFLTMITPSILNVFTRRLVHLSYDNISIHSRLNVKSAGVFCNFADGLVIDGARPALDMYISMEVAQSVYADPQMSADSLFTLDSPVVNYTGADVQVGDLIQVRGGTFFDSFWDIVVTRSPGVSYTISRPSPISGNRIGSGPGAVMGLYRLGFSAGAQPRIPISQTRSILNIPALNAMYDVQFSSSLPLFAYNAINTPGFGIDPYPYIIAVMARVKETTFRTLSINSDYAGANAIFQARLNLEYTRVGA